MWTRPVGRAQKNLLEGSPLAFFNQTQSTSKRAEEIAGEPVRLCFEIGGAPVQLRFAGPSLVPVVTAALNHLAIPSSVNPTLVVRVWDTTSTGITMPRPPWSADDVSFRGDVRGYNDDRISTAFQADATLLSIFDARRNEAVYWIRDPMRMPLYETAAPLLRIFHWWLQTRRMQVVHGGAVGTPAGGVLLAGRSGSGKSNTALACLEAGLGYAGDDYCVIAAGDRPAVFSLYNSGKTHAMDIARLPYLAPLISNQASLGSEKALYFLHLHYPERVVSQFPLRAILLPRVSRERNTTLRDAKPSIGVATLCPSTISQLPGASHQAIETIADICRRVPIYHIELGTDQRQIPEVISRLLSAA